MHELSIAHSMASIAIEHAREAGASRVTAITLQIGQLSCVHEDALRFGYEMVTEGTLLQGSQLVIEHMPIVIHCLQCNRDVALPSIQSFRCPVCGTPSGDVRQGRELDIVSIAFEVEEPRPSTSMNPDIHSVDTVASS